jgi:hypothetical protein
MSDDKEAARTEMLALEEQLIKAKAAGQDDPALKLQLRQARQRFRELRDGNPDPLGPGDATVKAGT